MTAKILMSRHMAAKIMTYVCELPADPPPATTLMSSVAKFTQANRDRIARKVQLQDAWASSTALWLALHSGSSLCSAPASSLDLQRRQEQTKPWLVSPQGPVTGLDIGLSHERRTIVCACSPAFSVGVDLLSVSRGREMVASEGGRAVLARRMPVHLMQTIDSLHDNAAKGLRYAVLWTLLESLAKARGVSLYSEHTRADLAVAVEEAEPHGSPAGPAPDGHDEALFAVPFDVGLAMEGTPLEQAVPIPEGTGLEAAAGHPAAAERLSCSCPWSYRIVSRWSGRLNNDTTQGPDWRATTYVLHHAVASAALSAADGHDQHGTAAGAGTDTVLSVAHLCKGGPQAWKEGQYLR